MCCFLSFLSTTSFAAPQIDPEIYLRLADAQAKAAVKSSMSTAYSLSSSDAADSATIPVIIYMNERVHPARGMTNKDRPKMLQSMRSVAERSQADVLSSLELVENQTTQSFWFQNAIVAKLDEATLLDLLELDEIKSVIYDQVIQRQSLPEVASTVSESTTGSYATELVYDGIQAMHESGFTGSGITVAVLDSGADFNHESLNGSWRGTDGDWYNPYAAYCEAGYFDDIFGTDCGTCDENADTPCDDEDSHGTAVSSRIVGVTSDGLVIGSAPDAKLIVAKVFTDSGSASYSGLIAGLQWLLDPDGDADTDDSPDVVNCSWGSTVSGTYDTYYLADIQALEDAGIAIVFSAGNYGSELNTDVSPANYAETFSVGSYGSNAGRDYVSSFSSRGPSALDGSVFPDVVGPGYGITAADSEAKSGTTSTYSTWYGTSFAAPTVTGEIALMMQADPSLTPSEIYEFFRATAVDIDEDGADNNAGYGQAQVASAYLASTLAIDDDDDDDTAVDDDVTVTGTVYVSVDSESTASVDDTDGPVTTIALGDLEAGQTAFTTVSILNDSGSSVTLSLLTASEFEDGIEIEEVTSTTITLSADESVSFTVALTPAGSDEVYAESLVFDVSGATIDQLIVKFTGSSSDVSGNIILTNDTDSDSGTTVNFGTLNEGSSTSASSTVTVTNSSTSASFTIDAIEFADDEDFGDDELSISNDTCSNVSLDPTENATCTFEVELSKSELQTLIASIDIETSIGTKTLSVTAAMNSAPSAPEVLTTIDGLIFTVDDDDPEASFTVEYSATDTTADDTWIEISTSSSFDECITLEYLAVSFGFSTLTLCAGFGFGFFGLRNRKQRFLSYLVMTVYLVMTLMLSGCGGGSSSSSSSSSSTSDTEDITTVGEITIQTESVTLLLSSFDETATYYLRAVSTDADGALSYSETQTFTVYVD
jgi:bacillopeptidase F